MKRLIIYSIFALISFFLLSSGPVNAQASPDFIITWKANTYAPSDYLGKIFPTQNSSIEIGFDIIINNKIVDLSKKQIKWAPDGLSQQAGLGLKKITIKTDKNNNDQIVKITIVNFDKNGDLSRLAVIPVVNPEVVINAPYYNREITPSENNLFEARPFFFNLNNIGKIAFFWFLNSEPISQQENVPSPNVFSLNLLSQGQIYSDSLKVAVTAQNTADQSESASKILNLKIK